MTRKTQIFIGLFFVFLSISLLSPLASNSLIPDGGDYGVHTAIIMQAKMALQEGQFPIRVAPWQHEGWGNAFFQFYSPFPAMLGGFFYSVFNYLHFFNPFIIFKMMMGLALFLGGIYFFRLTHWLSSSPYIALLSSVVYVTSPYFLVNIDVRGALSEAFAQGILPLVLYYTLKAYLQEMNFKNWILALLTWFVLLITHLITFIYSAFFIGLLLILLFVRDRTFFAAKKLMLLGVAFGISCLLASWYLVPILGISKYLFISKNQLINPFSMNWLTPLTTLLSSAAVNPIPHSTNGALNIPLDASIGWPILFGGGISAYLAFQNRLSNSHYIYLVFPLLIIFLIALFSAWSPLDFWVYLPKFLSIAQFPYRLLTQTMWIGTLMFSFALMELFKTNLDLKGVAIGIFLICIATSSWLTTLTGNTDVKTLIENPSLGYPASAYLINPETLANSTILGNTELPLVGENDLLINNKKIKLNKNLIQNNPDALIYLEGEILHQNKIEIKLQINDHDVIKKTISPGQFVWNIPLGKLLNKEKIAEDMNMQFISEHIGLNKKPTDIFIKSLCLKNLVLQNSALPVSQSKLFCSRKNAKLRCDISIPKKTTYVQLPVLYYPKLLDIKVDGKPHKYLPIVYRDYVLVGLRLNSGNHHISIKFIGIQWANWISILTLSLLLQSCILVIIRKLLYPQSRESNG